MSDTTVIVTGASAGIGLAIAERFASRGLRVISLARRRCPIDVVESLLIDLAGTDVVPELLPKLLPLLPNKAGVIHVIHNAAALPHDDALDVEGSVLERTLRLNVVTPSLLNAAIIPVMAHGSSIIFVGSTLSEKGVPGRLSYVTGKHAMLGLMRATVQDLWGRGINTLCVAPGFVDTGMLRPVLDHDPMFEREVLDMVSYGRLIEPEEIAEIVEFATRTPALNGALVSANLGQRQN
ncbi:oxidoreductase, short-chain dehydrogenase/reductase family protein [Enhygromyxa salina]|uniref:Oxidoreductase, short-chain dehydrogenase/reductase family protein n=1 Tax=Enhygromyxa salina TaxID=215803 RepID=A0A0C2DEK6_9BACT|nr:SDR family oxidoreductase [Enhygromyxa salina]KIG18117.1 oxidoreductase, short-chain dehydrogenase/reductase family protein [Enhygromyxa salina]